MNEDMKTIVSCISKINYRSQPLSKHLKARKSDILNPAGSIYDHVLARIRMSSDTWFENNCPVVDDSFGRVFHNSPYEAYERV